MASVFWTMKYYLLGGNDFADICPWAFYARWLMFLVIYDYFTTLLVSSLQPNFKEMHDNHPLTPFTPFPHRGILGLAP